MFAATLVLASVAQVAAPLASTYDEAACASDEAVTSFINEGAAEADELQPNDCAPPPVAPVVLDCNDERMSYFVGEMIGSCDMPKPPAPTATTPVVKAPAPRICDGLHCTHDSSPLCSSLRTGNDAQPIAPSAIALLQHFRSFPLSHYYSLIPHSDFSSRLERPPRA